LICQDTSLPSKVADNTKRFRTKMGALGFTVSGDNHAISPVMLGDAKLASRFSELMLSNYRIFHLFS
jgi:7-keto-8-aminopelargonate synthetase-like enzyme